VKDDWQALAMVISIASPPQPAPTKWPNIWHHHHDNMLCQLDAPHYDVCPDPMDMPRCVTPNPDLSMTTITQNSEQMIHTKMQYQWWEDMLPADQRAMLQEQTDFFLGKQPDIVLYNLSSNMIAEMTLPLPPVIVNPQAWLTGEGPSLHGTTGSTR
jgi:hypothetical protein